MPCKIYTKKKKITMKNLVNFEDFLNESKIQRTATIKAEADKEISRKLEKSLREAMKLTEEIEAEKAKFQAAVKIKELELKSRQAEIVEAMKDMDTTTLKFKKILATIEKTKGRVTHSYAKLWEFALGQSTASQKKALLTYQDLNKKINPDKISLEIKRVNEESINESLTSLLKRVWDFLKGKVEEVLSVSKDYTESVEALEKVVSVA